MIAKVLATEFMKLHRAKETWATLAVLALMPLGIALFMWIVREPGRAAQLGLLGTKASLAGLEATWPQYFYMLTLVFGVGGMLPGFSVELAATGIANAFLASAVSFLLAPVVAWIAVWSRGEVAAIAFSLVMLALGNLFGKTGWAEWFPYSIVPLLIGMVADPVDSLPAGSYVVLAGTFAAGTAATILQLRFADNAQ